jgi:hypothetical protein
MKIKRRKLAKQQPAKQIASKPPNPNRFKRNKEVAAAPPQPKPPSTLRHRGNEHDQDAKNHQNEAQRPATNENPNHQEC